MANTPNQLMPIETDISTKIFTLRGVQVMIDRDLAELYGVEAKRLNEQVKRNIERFPERFRFQLTHEEKNEPVAKCDRFESMKHSTTNPYAFTEQGVSMLSAILRSPTAIEVSIKIIDSFVQMRRYISQNALLFERVDLLERKQQTTEQKIDTILNAIEDKTIQPKQGIFYNGQIFDAYTFVSDLIRQAKQYLALMAYCVFGLPRFARSDGFGFACSDTLFIIASAAKQSRPFTCNQEAR